MSLSETVETWIPEDGWINARDVARKADCPLSSATSALATLERLRPDIQRKFFSSGSVKRPVWHYRKISGGYVRGVC